MQNNMKRYQNDFAIKFARLMEQRLVAWKQIQNSERKELYSLKSFGMYLISALIGFIPGRNEHEYHFTFHCWVALFCLIGGIITNIQLVNKGYQNKIKSTLFPELLTVFGEEIFYDRGSGIVSNTFVNNLVNFKSIADFVNKDKKRKNITPISNRIFEECKLYPEKITSREDDDTFHGKYQDVEFVMDEVDFGWNSNNRHHTYHSMFKGLAMKFDLHKSINARVLILTKHSFTKIPPNFERVNLEYEKFNKKYDVWVEKGNFAGSGQIEARYLLNTVFIERLMQIQTSFKVNKMCCSVFGNTLLIMLSTNRDLFEMNHLFGRIDDTSQYSHLFEEFASVLSFIEVLNLSSKTKL